jgi:hypothetical protein
MSPRTSSISAPSFARPIIWATGSRGSLSIAAAYTRRCRPAWGARTLSADWTGSRQNPVSGQALALRSLRGAIQALHAGWCGLACLDRTRF